MKQFGTNLARLDWDVKTPEMWAALAHNDKKEDITQIGSTDPDSPFKRFYDGNAKSWAKDIHPNGTEPSSWVSVIDYNSSSLELKITFRDGTTCLYKDISPDMAESFSQAESKGRWVHNNLVVNHHSYKIVTAGPAAKDIDLYHRGGLLGKNKAQQPAATTQPQQNAAKPTRVKNATTKANEPKVLNADLLNWIDSIFEGFRIIK